MKTKSVHILVPFFAALLLLSCRKEKTGSQKERLLTMKNWQYHEFGIDENFDGQIDIQTGFEDCAEDDLVKFNAGGKGLFDQGIMLCYPTFPQTQDFTWQFQSNETQLEYGGAIHTILKLDETQLAVYTEEDNGSGPVRHILVYRH
jgi:hypothetical protein